MSDMNSTMLSDKIENFILDLMNKQNTDELLLKRKDVADHLISVIHYTSNSQIVNNLF